MPINEAILDRLKNNDPTLVELNLSNQQPPLKDADIEKLARALEKNTKLISLDVSRNHIQISGAIALVKTKILFLNMRYNMIGAVATSRSRVIEQWDRGYHIDFTRWGNTLMQNKTLLALDVERNYLGPEGAKAVAKSVSITSLNCGANEIGFEGINALAQNTILIELDVFANNLGNKEAKVLAANKTLRSLNCRGNEIQFEGVEALAKNNTLTSLDLGSNRLGNDAFKVLASNTTLTTLNVSNNHEDDEGVEALAQNNSLTSLDISGNNYVREKGIQALAKNTTLVRLNASLIWHMGFESVEALAQNSTLTSLDISGNRIGDKGFETLAGSTSLIQLQAGNNGITDKGVQAFAERNKVVTSLNLSNKDNLPGRTDPDKNQVGPTGAAALAKNTTLISLELTNNNIGDKGSVVLAQSTSLSALEVSHNLIGSEGAKAFAKNGRLTTLNIGANWIRAEGTQSFMENNILVSLKMSDSASDSILINVRKHIEENYHRMIQRRDQFIQEIIILARDTANSHSQSLWSHLATNIKLHIIGLINFYPTENIGKNAEQIYQCAKFIFDHIEELNQLIKEKQSFKICERKIGGKREFLFFRYPAVSNSVDTKEEVHPSVSQTELKYNG